MLLKRACFLHYLLERDMSEWMFNILFNILREMAVEAIVIEVENGYEVLEINSEFPPASV